MLLGAFHIKSKKRHKITPSSKEIRFHRALMTGRQPRDAKSNVDEWWWPASDREAVTSSGRARIDAANRLEDQRVSNPEGILTQWTSMRPRSAKARITQTGTSKGAA